MAAARTIEDRVDVYASWVRTLRAGHRPPALPADSDDPLARLGRELELLSATLSAREAEFRGLLDLVQTVERGILLDDVLSKIYDAFKGLIPFERIGCAFLSDDGQRLVAYWARSELGPVQVEQGYSRPMAGSSLSEILSSGQPRMLNDLEAYLQAKPASDATRRIVAEGGRSSLTCPLVVNDQPLGFLFFTSRDKGAYRDAHVSIFRQIAHQVSVVIAKSRMYERLVAHNRVLLEQTRHLQVLADVDGLTGALTRRAIDSVVEQAWIQHVERGRLVGVMLLDIDHFKRINDTRGHAAGDDVLREVVRRVVAPLRKQDVCGRYGGEEFLIVAQDITGEQLLGAAERLRRAVAEAPMGTSGDIPVTVSVGLAHADEALASWHALVKHADEALYTAKARGRNQSWMLTSRRPPPAS